MTGETRAALHLRVSTADQRPDLQYDGLRACAGRAGLRIVGECRGHAVSGRRKGHPQPSALMAGVRSRGVDCVPVCRSVRFARSTRHPLTAPGEFDHPHVRFIGVQDRIDTASPMAGRCSRSSPPWRNWNPRSSASGSQPAWKRRPPAEGVPADRPSIPGW